MSDVMTKKLNKGYLMRLYSFFQAERPTRSETIVRGWIYSMTRSEEHECRFGYSNFKEKLGLSRSTVARITRKLRTDGIISARRAGGQKSVYTYDADIGATSHIRTELWFYDVNFNVGGVDRKLTNAEVDVLSLIYTHTRNDKTKRFEGSVREIAAILNLSEKTVMRAITALFAAELIFRPGLGVNRHKKSVFVANMKLIREHGKRIKKAEKAKEKAQAQLPAHVQAANAKAERDKFYAARLERNRELADHYAAQAKQHPRFDIVNRALSKLNMEMAKAEINDPATLPTLKEKEKELQYEFAQILETQKVEKWQLDERAHAICKKCFDTGWQSDGLMCSCYRCRS